MILFYDLTPSPSPPQPPQGLCADQVHPGHPRGRAAVEAATEGGFEYGAGRVRQLRGEPARAGAQVRDGVGGPF